MSQQNLAAIARAGLGSGTHEQVITVLRGIVVRVTAERPRHEKLRGELTYRLPIPDSEHTYVVAI